MSGTLPQNTPQDLMSGNAFPVQALQDLDALSELEEAACEGIAKSLRELSSNGDFADVPRVVHDHLGESHQATNAILRLLTNVSNDEVSSTLESLDAWVSMSPSRQEAFTDDRMHRIRTNFITLINEYPIIDLNKKAQCSSTSGWKHVHQCKVLLRSPPNF